jgi:hypothetical protein
MNPLLAGRGDADMRHADLYERIRVFPNTVLPDSGAHAAPAVAGFEAAG